MLLIRGDSADWQQRVVKHPEIMSDRFHSLAVVLEKDIRDDDAKQIMTAICQLRGVILVTGNVADFDSHMAEVRAKTELGKKIIDVIYPPKTQDA